MSKVLINDIHINIGVTVYVVTFGLVGEISFISSTTLFVSLFVTEFGFGLSKTCFGQDGAQN